MPAVARKGDSISHGGSIVEGSPNVEANGIPVARVGDKVACALHGLQTITTGNPKWLVNGKEIARVGSLCSCGAVVTSGSPNVISNN